MHHMSPTAPLARVTGLGDYPTDVDLENCTTETDGLQARAGLVASIAADKLEEKKQWLSDLDLVGGLRSAKMAHATAIRRAYLAGDASLGAFVRELIVASMAADADTEADQAV